MSLLQFLFDGHPEPVGYDNPKVIALLILAFGLMAASYGIKLWRSRQPNPVTRTLSRSWAAAAFWFGFTALVFVISRTEGVFFLSIRFMWVLWLAAAIFYIIVQVRLFGARHYEVLTKTLQQDPREKYLPKRKRR